MTKPEPGGIARILVVDDDARIAAAVHRALSYEGYDVDVAGDGPAALRCARRGHVHRRATGALIEFSARAHRHLIFAA